MNAHSELPVLRVFLPSPSDVADERALARTVMTNLNDDVWLRDRAILRGGRWGMSPPLNLLSPPYKTKVIVYDGKQKKPSKNSAILDPN